MKTREKSLWRWLSRARCTGHHLERVENYLSRSTPDVECSTGRGGFWIELKTAARPNRLNTPVRFRFQPGQSKWLEARWRLDRCAWLLVQVGPVRYMVPGLHASTLEDGVPEWNIVDLSFTAPDAGPEEVLSAASEAIWGDKNSLRE